MQFEEQACGDYRIYAGAMEAQGGYVAAVVVNRMQGPGGGAPREAFRDTSMSGGHRWPSATAALSFAVKHAQHLIAKQPQKLVC